MNPQDKVSQLQVLQQNLQNVSLQKQQLHTQVIEIDSALTELKNTSQAYKIVGKIMLASSKEELEKDLLEKKEVIEIRLKNFVQQEEKLQQNIDDLQKEVMEELKNK
jgi:prefoldin beta subunit